MKTLYACLLSLLWVLPAQATTLEEVCRFMEGRTLQLGNARLMKVDHSKQLSVIQNEELNQIFAEDLKQILATVYILPLKTEEDVKAYATLVYKACITQNR